MNQTSNELSRLQLPSRDPKTSQIADIYKNSNLLLNDLFTTIANYKITGENVAAKQEMMLSKMKLIDRTASDVSGRTTKFYLKSSIDLSVEQSTSRMPNNCSSRHDDLNADENFSSFPILQSKTISSKIFSSPSPSSSSVSAIHGRTTTRR